MAMVKKSRKLIIRVPDYIAKVTVLTNMFHDYFSNNELHKCWGLIYLIGDWQH